MLKKRSIMIAGHATSVSLEEEFWDVLREIAERRTMSINQLVTEIDLGRGGNLSSAIRVFVLEQMRHPF
jgi:predicted DNA-binding ribbon-helix-helix protein